MILGILGLMGGGKRDVWVYLFSPIFTTPGSVVHSGAGSRSETGSIQGRGTGEKDGNLLPLLLQQGKALGTGTAKVHMSSNHVPWLFRQELQ
jgi:hypothetical protein